MATEVNFSSVKDLENFYKKFKNKNLKELSDFITENYAFSLATNKGVVGQVLEGLIGNKPNSDPRPDVAGINVELKVLPLRKSGGTLKPKERSKIKSINYNEIIKEDWETSFVKNKMSTMLFLVYEQPIGQTFKDWEEFIFKGTILYKLDNEEPMVVKNDWIKIKQKVVKEIADQISEGDSDILGACTSGTGKLITYGNGSQAKQRSYSLKHSYLKYFYEKTVKKGTFVNLPIDNSTSPEQYVLSKFLELSNKTLPTIAAEFDIIYSSTAKSSIKLLLNRALNVMNDKKIADLEKNGIVIKTIPVDGQLNPHESMSFPKFSLADIINEKWDESECECQEPEECTCGSEFKSIIEQTFIFVPVIKEKNKTGSSKYVPWEQWKIGKSVIWKPNQSEIEQIRKEWSKVRETASQGIKVWNVQQKNRTIQKNNLLKSSESVITHIRPHAKDSSQIDVPYKDLKGVSICWQSFWLNSSYTAKILQGNLLK